MKIQHKKAFIIAFLLSTAISSLISISFSKWYIDMLNEPIKSPVPENWMELRNMGVGEVGATEPYWIGEASWYGTGEKECLGCSKNRTMANGQKLDDSKFTVACGLKSTCKNWKMGTKIRIENLKNGKTVEAIVTDKGGLREGRIIDVSKAVRSALQFTSVAKVKVTLP